MRPIVFAALLGLAGALAACGPEAPKKETYAPTPLAPAGWTQIFANPAESIDVMNRLGFRIGAYAPAEGGHKAVGIPAMLSRSDVLKPNVTNVELTGTADTLTAVRFTLDLTDLSDDGFAKKQFVKQIKQRFAQLGVAGADKLTQNIMSERPTNGTTAGANYALTRDLIPGGKNHRRITLTFTPAGSTPATSAPRNG
ncbi:hypothetical protein [Sphingomonas sp. 28-62-11]|uniref:hypothetical protein n=1 Tax=Sphingomonas sp. 28-62-11 TaxID=1970432 RepID=UPI000BDA074F|nr:MAG: hypothetical protein B7Y49_06635 [Sphingomonas sp. 28-62-11]